jgi:putative proteasome-type protease
MYETDSFFIRHQLRLPLGDPYLAKIRHLWECSLRQAFERMPNVEWDDYDHEAENSQEDVLLD